MGGKGAILKKNIVFKAILRALSYDPDGIVTPQMMFDEDTGSNRFVKVL